MKEVSKVQLIRASNLALSPSDDLVVTEEPLEVTEREGSFGIMMRSDSSNSRCEGRNIWAYAVPR